MFQTWHAAFRGVVLYRVSLALLLLGALFVMGARRVGAPFDTLATAAELAATALIALSVCLFAFSVPIWVPVARGVSAVSGLLMVGAVGLAVWRSSTNVGYSVSAYELVHTLNQLSHVSSALGMVLFASAWRAAAESTSHALVVQWCTGLMLTSGVSGVASFLLTFDSLEHEVVFLIAALLMRAAVFATAWHTATGLRAALLPRG